MVDKIMAGIATAISNKYDKVTVYTDKSKQDLVIPCFLILNLTHENDNLLGNRTKISNSFVIQYFSDSDRADVRTKGEELVSILKFIDVDTVIMHGTNMSYQIVDEVLNLFVDYNYISTDVVELETMNDIAINMRGGK